jgi:hypothetical protein
MTAELNAANQLSEQLKDKLKERTAQQLSERRAEALKNKNREHRGARAGRTFANGLTPAILLKLT